MGTGRGLRRWGGRWEFGELSGRVFVAEMFWLAIDGEVNIDAARSINAQGRLDALYDVPSRVAARPTSRSRVRGEIIAQQEAKLVHV